MAYLYVVTKKGDGGGTRLIEAGTPAHAIAHCAKDAFEAERVSANVAKLTGLAIEKVTPEAAAK